MRERVHDGAGAAHWWWPALFVVTLMLAVLVLPPLAALRSDDAPSVAEGRPGVDAARGADGRTGPATLAPRSARVGSGRGASGTAAIAAPDVVPPAVRDRRAQLALRALP